MKWQILWSIIAAVCILYGCLIWGLRSGTSFFAVWLVLGGIFFLMAAAARLELWQKLPAGGRTAIVILAVCCAAVFIITEVRIAAVGFRTSEEEDLDYLIVLGAQIREDGPSVVLRYRLDTACSYMEKNPRTVCIVSGGQGWNEPCSEAEGMRRYLLEKGIPEERILAETESRNTLENIQNSMTMLDPEEDRVGIVTNNFHIYRGCAIAEKAGIRNVYGIAAPSKILYLPNNMFREFFGVVKDILRGNMSVV